VGSAISCVVIQSDQIFRKIPALGQVVGVLGEKSPFVVVDVNQNSGVAQLMEKSGKHRLMSVPFASIRAFNHNLAKAIRHFLETREEPKKREFWIVQSPSPPPPQQEKEPFGDRNRFDRL
jgi:hypothetical protein